MANVDKWLQEVADAKASGNNHAVNWLTACWMPYPATTRALARSGDAKPQSETPAGPIQNGKIVFHASAVRRGLGPQIPPPPETTA